MCTITTSDGAQHKVAAFPIPLLEKAIGNGDSEVTPLLIAEVHRAIAQHDRDSADQVASFLGDRIDLTVSYAAD